MPQITTVPSLNTADIPEHYMLGFRKTKSRSVWMPKPENGEAHTEASNIPSSEMKNDGNDATDAEVTDWACPRCTFQNAGIMPVCEMCEQARDDPYFCKSDVVSTDKKQHIDIIEDDNVAWPTPAEVCDTAAPMVCETTSISSSWVDVTEVQEFMEDSGILIIDLPANNGHVAAVTHEESAQEKRTWAARVASKPEQATNGESACIKPDMQRPAMALPPLWCQRPQVRNVGPKKSIVVCEDDDAHELDLLYTRRLHPQSLHGFTQRRRQERQCKRNKH